MTKPPRQLYTNLVQSGTVLGEALKGRNFKVLASMLGPAYRGLIQQRGKAASSTQIALDYSAHFDWKYERNQPDLSRLYEIAKSSQWNSTTDLSCSTDIDPFNVETLLLPESFLPTSHLGIFAKLSSKEKLTQQHALMSWLLSQFLHGEQGALFSAAQVTEAVPGLDAKLYGSTQVVDEGRHVEVFHRYVSQKLEKLYEINDNLYVIIDALMSDSRWDVKFLGMQIMVEGLALGAFSTIRQVTREPLLKDMLKYVIADEGRHVHYGVLALRELYTEHLSSREVREREDWAFEVAVLLRNRFLAHEFYDEFYAHAIKRSEWNKLMIESNLMTNFRKTMFKRLIPNLKRIGLLSDRIRPRYAALGLLEYENEKAAPDLTGQDLLEDESPRSKA